MVQNGWFRQLVVFDKGKLLENRQLPSLGRPSNCFDAFPMISYNFRNKRPGDQPMSKADNPDVPLAPPGTAAEIELQQLVDTLPQHIVVLSPNGTRLHGNQVALEYYGLTPQQFLMKPITEFFHPDDVQNYSRVRNAAI